MARKVAGAKLLLLVALLLSSSAGGRLECWVHEAKNPSCGTGHKTDTTCAKQCKSEGYHGWMCIPNCSCLVCQSLHLERCGGTMELQKRGNRSAPAAGVGAF